MFASWALGEDEAGAAHNHGQEIIEIVRDATRQQTNALQLLRLPQAFFDLPPLGDLHAHANEADRVAAIVVAFGKYPPI
jgi:hypothetical protein